MFLPKDAHRLSLPAVWHAVFDSQTSLWAAFILKPCCSLLMNTFFILVYLSSGSPSAFITVNKSTLTCSAFGYTPPTVLLYTCPGLQDTYVPPLVVLCVCSEIWIQRLNVIMSQTKYNNSNEQVFPSFAGVEMFLPIKCPKMIWPHSGTRRRSKWGNPFHCPLLMMSLWNVWLLMIWACPVKFLSLVSFANRCVFIFLKPCLCARSATVGLCLCRSTWGVLHTCSDWGCEHCWCPLPTPTGCHVQVETGLCYSYFTHILINTHAESFGSADFLSFGL